jgi:galactokinase
VNQDFERWVGLAVADFEGDLGVRPECASWAPGRVNLIGEHTDYSGGLVLPCAIDRHLLAIASARSDRRVRVRASDLDTEAILDVDRFVRRGDFGDYVQGICAALLEAGLTLGGLDLSLTSRVPLGAGLSSSAALGLAVVGAFDAVYELGLSPLERAQLAHRAESHFVGVGCGILDQFAVALGRAGHALRIDCRSQAVRAIPFPAEDIALLVVHSGVTRALVEGAYRARVEACEAATEAARGAGLGEPGLRSLRDLRLTDLAALEAVVDPEVFRRARHVVHENARVDAFCEALTQGDHARMGGLLAEGQASLRDDFEVSAPELDAACELASGVEGIIGSRLTGAGFGGCTLHLVERDQAAAAEAELGRALASRFGAAPRSWVVEVADGAAVRRL